MESFAILVDYLTSGAAHCRAVVAGNGGLLGTLLVAGLVGGAGHCVAMCGPFVIAQSVARLEAQPAAEMREFHRLTGAALAPYHLGRMTTYAVLGGLAAGVAGGLMNATGMRWLSAGLLAVAAILFLGYGIRRFSVRLPGAGNAESWWSRTVGDLVRPLFGNPVGLRGYVLGLVLGFLPCGLLYGALAAAAASGSALAGSLAMAAFAAGTVPALLVVGLAGHMAGRRWQGMMTRLAPVLMLLNALILSLMAWRAIA